MKKLLTLSLILLGFSQIECLVSGEENGMVEYKTAKECYDAAKKIEIGDTADKERGMLWGKKFGLLKRAIELDPKFTDAYVPYVKTYFEQPMVHEFDHTDEINEMIELLKRGLQYNPRNGDEFYLELVRLEESKWDGSHDESYHNRSIDYLDHLLKEYPDSDNRPKALLLKSLHLRKTGKIDESIGILVRITESSVVDENKEVALGELISHYAFLHDYSKLRKFCEVYLKTFGENSSYSDVSLFWLTQSNYRLGFYEEALESGNRYIKKNADDPKRKKTLNSMYLIFADIYDIKGNDPLSQKYKKLSQ